MGTGKGILICGVNWLGDSVMTMPALQEHRRRYPDCRRSILVRPELAPLWRMHEAVDEVLVLRRSPGGTRQAARSVRTRGFAAAHVFANSFRSALIPYLGGVSQRIGARGHGRAWMLTHVIERPADTARRHQAWEYIAIMGLLEEVDRVDTPRLSVPELNRGTARRRMCDGDRWVGLMPGAAYGPSKRWPAEHFVAVGRMLRENTGCRIAVFGSQGERSLCRSLARDLGEGALMLAGKTSLADLVALLEGCEVVIGNDSGGMHLAAAAGTGTVSVFGMTDPERTAPLGGDPVVITDGSGPGSRDIPRDCPEAGQRLRRIEPERVCRAALTVLESRKGRG